MNKKTYYTTIGFFLYFFTTYANANLIQNGSFELGDPLIENSSTGVMTLSAGSMTIYNWATIDSNIDWIDNSNTFNVVANNGDRSIDLTGFINDSTHGGIMQSISTDVGTNYELSFYLGAIGNLGLSSIEVTAANSSNTFTYFVDSTNTSTLWEKQTLLFTANSLTTDISFRGINGNISYIGLDDVTVNAVPLPGSFILMSMGIVFLGGYGRRKNRAMPISSSTLTILYAASFHCAPYKMAS